jgi:hypothetical protein
MKTVFLAAILIFSSALVAQAEMRRAEIKVFGMD